MVFHVAYLLFSKIVEYTITIKNVAYTIYIHTVIMKHPGRGMYCMQCGTTLKVKMMGAPQPSATSAIQSFHRMDKCQVVSA